MVRAPQSDEDLYGLQEKEQRNGKEMAAATGIVDVVEEEEQQSAVVVDSQVEEMVERVPPTKMA